MCDAVGVLSLIPGASEASVSKEGPQRQNPQPMSRDAGYTRSSTWSVIVRPLVRRTPALTITLFLVFSHNAQKADMSSAPVIDGIAHGVR